MSKIKMPGDPKYVDYLDEDPAIPSQKYACISFVAPEADQKCEITGFKIRGVYPTVKEAKKRSERIANFDPDFHVFVCPVGVWCPYNPDPNDIQDEVYKEGVLNDIVRGYKENKMMAEDFNEERKREMIKKAIKDGSKRNRMAIEEEKEHPVAVKDKLVRLPKEIEKMEKKLEETKKLLEEKQKEWSKLGEKEIESAEKEYKKVVEGEAEGGEGGEGGEGEETEGGEAQTAEEAEGGESEQSEEERKRNEYIKKKEQEEREAEIEKRNRLNKDLERVAATAKRNKEEFIGSANYKLPKEAIPIKNPSPEELKEMEKKFRKEAFGNESD